VRRIGILATLVAVPALGAVERFALIAGNNRGQSDEANLRYAEDDARKVKRVLTELGAFPEENLVLLEGRDAVSMRRALVSLNDRIRARVEDPSVEPLLFVYYSGHADARALHMGDGDLELLELEQLVRGSAAKYRILVVDACRSGSLTNVKGGTPEAPFPVRIEERLSGEGTVFLTSSSATEDAQESDELRGSFFTHAFVSALLGAGDANGDDRVTLREAYAYAYDSTLRASSRSLAGTQHPTFHYDVRGKNDLVLTEVALGSERALLAFPDDRSYLVLEGSEDGVVIAEIGALDRVRTISVSAGRYFLRSRGRDHLLEGAIEASRGSRITIREDTLERVEYARLVRKGHGVVEVAHGPLAGYRGRSPIHRGASFCHGAFVAYPVDREAFSLVPIAGFCRSGFANAFLEATTYETDLGLRVTRAFDLPVVSIALGVGAGGAVIHQAFATTGTAPPRTTGAGFATASVEVSADLGLGILAGVEGAAWLFVLSKEGDEGTSLGASLAGSFGVFAGKRW
jgi:hypothetical protein